MFHNMRASVCIDELGTASKYFNVFASRLCTVKVFRLCEAFHSLISRVNNDQFDEEGITLTSQINDLAK